jgi:hypothetical protein
MPRSWKTLAVLAATGIAALILSTTALGALSGRGHFSGGWAVILGSSTGAALSPDGATEYLPFTIVNASGASRVLRSVVASVPADPAGDAETATGAEIPGCPAAWFRIAVDPGDGRLPRSLAPGTAYTGRLVLTMSDSASNQDACEQAAPAVRLTAG